MNTSKCQKNFSQIQRLILLISVLSMGCSSSPSEGSSEVQDTANSTHSVQLTSSIQPNCSGKIPPPITTGYGAKGQYKMRTLTFRNPLWRLRQVSVFLPEGATSPVPVIFFSHGYGGVNPRFYQDLIEHIVSQGYALVYSPYPSIGTDHQGRYKILWAGFEQAAKNYSQYLDLTQVGFMGHSYGGGATPAMAYRGLTEKGWGSRGALMFIMAPWYFYNITPAQLQSFPKNTKLLIEVYEEDEFNDHRIAIDLFKRIQLPLSEKDYVMIRSDRNQGCELIANHQVPQTSGRRGYRIEVNSLDYYGVYRLFDALADYTFNGNLKGKEIALGHGTSQQTYMGNWRNGGEIKRIISSSNPQPVRDPSFYKSPGDLVNDEE